MKHYEPIEVYEEPDLCGPEKALLKKILFTAFKDIINPTRSVAFLYPQDHVEVAFRSNQIREKALSWLKGCDAPITVFDCLHHLDLPYSKIRDAIKKYS